MQLLQGAAEHDLNLAELFRGATDIILLLQWIANLKVVHIVYVEIPIYFIILTLCHHAVEQVILTMLHALLILLEFCRKTNGHYVVFAIKLRIEPQELSQYVAIVLLLICFGEVNVPLLHLEEADDKHEETIRSQTSMPRLVQPIDL